MWLSEGKLFCRTLPSLLGPVSVDEIPINTCKVQRVGCVSSNIPKAAIPIRGSNPVLSV